MIISIQSVAVGASWQVKIGLHEFDNCLSRVKSHRNISRQQLFLVILKMCGEFIFQQHNAQAHRACEIIRFLACNFAKC